MTARSVSAGSQPAIDITCDEPHCMCAIREFVDTVREARVAATSAGWISDRTGADYCKAHG